MKKYFLAGIAICAGLSITTALAADVARPLAVVPAPILQPGIEGYVGIGGAFASVSPSSSTNIWGAAFGGAVNIPVGALNVELEGAGAAVNLHSGSTTITTSYSRGMVHLFHRTSGFAVGGFGGFENLGFISPTFWDIGAEAQAYLNRINLYGQVAFQSASSSSIGGGHSGWWTRGGVQFFLSDNFLIEGDIRYTSSFLGSGSGATTFAGGAEARMAGPWSIFGTVRYTTASTSSGGNVTTGLVGVRAHFGNGTLLQQNTTGASMNTLPLL